MVLVTGSPDELTSSIVSLLEKEGHIYVLSTEYHNLRDRAFIEGIFAEVKPRSVVNCASFSSMDEAEVVRDQAYGINSMLPGILADNCARDNIPLVHISSSHVFSGLLNRPYREADDPDPVSVYGDSFYLGEKLVLQSGCPFLIVRAGDILGSRIIGPEGLIHRGGGSILQVPACRVAPVSPDFLAVAVVDLMHREARGIFHIGPEGNASLAEIYTVVLQMSTGMDGRGGNMVVEERDRLTLPMAGEISCFNVLDNSRFKSYTGLSVASWKEMLRDYMERHKFE